MPGVLPLPPPLGVRADFGGPDPPFRAAPLTSEVLGVPA